MIEPNHKIIREKASDYADTIVTGRDPAWWKVYNAYKRGCYSTIKFLNEEENSRREEGEIKP
ncbi:hypothetical protein [uncultured Draconibacterium sp.]|uniref:hypothetical protein n=1 Tax=uncultured Draconibacterium sp. TaxID=1573823 RepID=UPI0032179B85